LDGARHIAAVRGKNSNNHLECLLVLLYRLAMKPFCLSHFSPAIAKITNTTNENL